MTTEPPTFCDESDTGFGWISAEPPWMQRASHAIASNGGVWLIDPVDFAGLDDRVRTLGEPRGVIQLLDRHRRDAASVATRLGVPQLVTPQDVPDSPFEMITVPAIPGWRETGLWWAERQTLVVAEAVGTARYYCAPGRPLGVHPLLRMVRPPVTLLRFEPDHLLCGHGAGIHDDTTATLHGAVRRSRRELPALLPRLLTARR
ncbi:MAG: hypothetical protein WCH31_07320 [Actinomycetes bacterium]